jgi:hypothetical protein
LSNCVQFADIDSFSTLGRLPENRLRAILLAFFSLTAVSLACVGLYGTLSYAMNGRRREVGLRQALGVLRTQVVRQFLVQGLRVSLLGSLGGPALAIAFARLRSGMLYGVSVSDPMTLGGVVVLVLAVSVVPSLLPEIRAARLEPMQVLREERRAHARAIARVGGQAIAYLPPLPRSDRECADDAGLVSGVFLPPRRATMKPAQVPTDNLGGSCRRVPNSNLRAASAAQSVAGPYPARIRRTPWDLAV